MDKGWLNGDEKNIYPPLNYVRSEEVHVAKYLPLFSIIKNRLKSECSEKFHYILWKQF